MAAKANIYLEQSGDEKEIILRTRAREKSLRGMFQKTGYENESQRGVAATEIIARALFRATLLHVIWIPGLKFAVVDCLFSRQRGGKRGEGAPRKLLALGFSRRGR